MPRPPRPAPREYVEDWTGDLDLDASLYDLPEVSTAHAFARNLREAMDGRSGREIGRLTGVDFTAINKILRGQTWPDMATIARLEAGLGDSLWPEPRVRRGLDRSSSGGQFRARDETSSNAAE